MELIPIDYTSDRRVGKRGNPTQWPDLDVFGNTYEKPASTMNLPHNRGLFVVVPLGFPGQSSLELYEALKAAPAVKTADVATPITDEEAAKLPDVVVEVKKGK